MDIAFLFQVDLFPIFFLKFIRFFDFYCLRFPHFSFLAIKKPFFPFSLRWQHADYKAQSDHSCVEDELCPFKLLDGTVYFQRDVPALSSFTKDEQMLGGLDLELFVANLFAKL